MIFADSEKIVSVLILNSFFVWSIMVSFFEIFEDQFRWISISENYSHSITDST